jgi:sugar phosphate isomerase/epimerase
MVGRLGVELVLTIFGSPPTSEAVEALSQCADLLATEGAKPAIEFAPASPVATIAQADAVVCELGPQRATILADSWHFSRGQSTWEQLETVPLEHLGIVQFDDAPPPISDDLMDETTNRRTWPGEGEFDLTRFATTLLDRGWCGPVAVEVLSTQARALSIEDYARRSYDTTAPYWTS